MAGGDGVVITRDGEPIARLMPLSEVKRPRRKAGSAAGKAWMSEDFDEPLTEFAGYM